MKRAKLFALVAGAAATFAFTTACESPDSQKRFDEYSEIVGDAEQTSELCESETQDLTGKYFLRLQHSIGPQANILMEVDIKPNGDNWDFVFQPLKTDITEEKIDLLDENGDVVYALDKEGNIRYHKNGDPRIEQVNAPRADARTHAGAAILQNDVAVAANGEMEIVMTGIIVDAEANSFTWGEIEADIDLTVAACSSGVICGKGKIETYRPLPLKGTANFGALEVESIERDSTAPLDCDSEPI